LEYASVAAHTVSDGENLLAGHTRRRVRLGAFEEATPRGSAHARELGRAFFASAVRTYGPDAT
jgi:hypothetical protein